MNVMYTRFNGANSIDNALNKLNQAYLHDPGLTKRISADLPIAFKLIGGPIIFDIKVLYMQLTSSILHKYTNTALKTVNIIIH